MIGRKIGHYRIEEQIGSGAMGVVYRARDERLRRDVALKFLPVNTLFNLASRQRFRREALSLSRLNHPTVAVLHDFISEGNAECIVMEFIAGESLDRMIARGPVSEREALRLATQLADGLSAAHRAGVIHRDLKPSNLRVTPDGRLKILDFGLAKRLVGTVQTGSAIATEVDTVMGTLPYIAPELWKGGTASEASDLYAAGVVLYETATGSRPFPDLAGSALQHAVMNLPSPPPRSRNPGLSAEFEAIILRCLDRDPASRFHSAEELRVALESLQSSVSAATAARPVKGRPRLSRTGSVVLGVALTAALVAGWMAARPQRIRSLAVLPFTNLSGNPAQEYFADGMTDELIARLSEQRSLRVISRTSMMRYKQTRKRLPEIASELGVDGVVQGSIQSSGERVRISVQLIEGHEDRQLWGDQFEGDQSDALAIQTQLAQAIAQEIGLKLESDKDRPTATVDPAAYQLYLQGRFEWNRRNPEGIRRSISYFSRAIERDSLYPLPYAGLADAWSIAGLQAIVPRAEAYPRARRAAERALSLDPGLSEAYVSLANILQNYDWDWKGAGQAYRRAIRLNRNNAVAHHWYANHLALQGRFGPARAEIRRALELDPLSLPIGVGAGVFLYFERRYAEALSVLEQTAQMDSTSGLLQRSLAATYDRLGREEAAARAVQRWLASESPAAGEAAARAYAQSGFGGMVRFLIAATHARRAAGYEPASRLAELYSRIGDRENAFRWLEVALQEQDTELNRLKVDPIFDSLRTDPRYGALLRRIGLANPV